MRDAIRFKSARARPCMSCRSRLTVEGPGAIERSDRAALERLIGALPTEFREVIVLREIEELSYKEISEIVGVPIGTVMSRLARARKRLAAALRIDAKEAG